MKCEKVCSFLFFFFLFLVFGIKAFTQEILDRKITFEVENVSLKNILELIETQSKIKFAYSSGTIGNDKISISVHDVRVSDVLNKLLKKDFSYEVIGDVIVLKKTYENFDPGTVTGKVTDDKGLGLPGVSIRVKGNSTGTSTGTDGTYSLYVPDKESVLIFSYIGFIRQEVRINDLSPIDVTLVSDLQNLSEVIVIGFGTQKRENVIGSISTLNNNELANRPVTQLQNALTGHISGVTVIQRNGRPGIFNGTVNIRGIGSFGAAATVLTLVDGIPIESLSDVDPNDVESISVLKDASSAAIYGARAANGVILVTTKSGAKGKSKVFYNGYFGAQVATAIPQFVNSWEYASAYNEGIPVPQFTKDQIQKYKDGSDPDNFANTDFLDMVLRKYSSQTGHNVSLSGGNENNIYNTSFGYLFQDGLVDQNNYLRYNARVNMTTTISSKLNFTTRVAAISSDVNEPGTGVTDIIGEAIKLPAIYTAKYSNGEYGVGINSGTPISDLASKSFYKTNHFNINGNGRLDYNPIRGLRFSGIASYIRTEGKSKTFKATQQLRGLFLGPNHLSEERTLTRYFTFQGLADYTIKFRKHQINALAGYSFETAGGESSIVERGNFPGNDLTVIDLGSPITQTNSGTAYEWAIESQFARTGYSYAGKYLLEGAIRRDGSSRFPTEMKYAYFPSVAVGWRIGQEQFMDQISWLSELKIKTSRGVLGNQNISNYPYQNTLSVVNGTTGTVYSFGGVVVPGVARRQIANPALRWESTRTTDVGLEFGIFDNKLTGSATYFKRYTYDILYSPGISVSKVLGFTLSQQNTGKLENNGWEFTLNYNNAIGEIKININSNFSIINNKTLDLGVGNIHQPNGLVGNGNTLFIGYPIQSYYGYVADGLFVNENDIASWPKYSTAITSVSKPGDIRYTDISGPEGVPDGIIDATYDRIYLGSRIPKYTYGSDILLSFRGFDLNLLFQGVSGVKGNLSGNFGWAFNNGANIQRWQYEGRWTPGNPDRNAIYPRVEALSSAGSANTPLSSFWILNGSYLRLKSAQIGYALPEAITRKINIPVVRIYLSGENIFTIDNYRKGWDPEINTGSNFYPILASYVLGLNVTL